MRQPICTTTATLRSVGEWMILGGNAGDPNRPRRAAPDPARSERTHAGSGRMRVARGGNRRLPERAHSAGRLSARRERATAGAAPCPSTAGAAAGAERSTHTFDHDAGAGSEL